MARLRGDSDAYIRSLTPMASLLLPIKGMLTTVVASLQRGVPPSPTAPVAERYVCRARVTDRPLTPACSAATGSPAKRTPPCPGLSLPLALGI
jgi:hypothetical protein